MASRPSRRRRRKRKLHQHDDCTRRPGLETPDHVAMFSEPASALYWPPHAARYNMDALLFSSSAWLRTACIVSALFWVAFRAYQVLTQPVEKLVQVLGLEVPVAPLVSLAGIKADGVLLHWKPPDQRTSILKYVIRINGIDIGDISPQESSITIENLQPDRHYTIRIVTLNSSSFQAPSVPIRLRTLPAESDEFYGPRPPKDAQPGTDNDYTPTPVIRPNKSLADVVTSVAAPPMTREHSNSTSRMRRPDVGRRSSPASQDQGRTPQEPEGPDSIRQLTEKLDGLRRDLDDMERQIQDEDQEFVTQKAILADKRDEKKAALKEKEDASRDLRKEVASLERQNAAAQTKRAQQEKVLRQKEAERKKLKDDVAKWTRESGELRETAEKIKKEQAEYESASEKRIQELKDKYADETQANKVLEDAIREKGIHIKALEEERKKLEEGQEGGEAPDGPDNAEKEEDNRWRMTLGLLQQQYAQAWSLYAEAERAHHDATNRLTYMQQRRLSQPQLFSGPPVPEMGPVRRNSQRARPLSMREGLLSSATGGFVHTSSAPFNSIPTTSSPSFANPTPYFNPVNGMALPPRTYSTSFSQADFESLTGGAPMSPTAGALLPAGLFGDDLGLTEDEDDDPGPPQAPSLDPSPNMRNVLPGLGAPGTMHPTQNSSSPASPQSQSPSAFASPRESASELHTYPSNDNVDSDKRSIHSSSSSFQINPQASRFGGLFGLNRARGKTFSDEGPALGSLKPSQSQSLPRQEHGLDGLGSSRRRGSHSEGAWYDSFIRTKTQPVESSSSPKHVATRKRPFNMFGSAKGDDPWLRSMLGMQQRPSSPRQGSTNSGEGMALPRPSTESQTRFGWNVDAFGARASPLGVDWSVNNTNTTSWSRLGSRRPSMQHSSSANLIKDDMMHDDVLDFPSNTRSPTQAPIGTRPQSSASHMPAQPSTSSLPPIPPTPPKQLNPAAASFSMFQLGKKTEEDKARRAAEKEAKKTEKAEKKEEKEKKAKDKTSRKDKHTPSEAGDSREATSPHWDSRMSRDTPSISTADASETSPRESLERSVSHTASDAAGSIGKESFMQKLTRKGSTNQFLTFGKKSALFSKSKAGDVPGTPDEVEEEGSNGFFGLGKSSESVGNSPSIGTSKDKASVWGSIKRMGKKDKTPSLHESIASEATGDEEDVAESSRTVTFFPGFCAEPHAKRGMHLARPARLHLDAREGPTCRQRASVPPHTMASPAAENMPNGISTPPATNNAPTLSPPTQPQPASQQPSQPSNGSNAPANNGPTTTTTASATTSMNAAFPPTSLQDNGTSKRPRDARLIHLVLANMGVHAYTERVPLQLLDFAYRYTSSILSDALSYEPPLPTTSGSKKRGGGGGANAEASDDGISLNALRTAVGARAASTFQSSLGKEFMSEVALERNRIALPRVEREFGVRLPPERYCFTGVGWGVKGAWEEEVEEEGGEDADADVDMEDDGAGAGPGASAAGFGGPVGGVNGGAGAGATADDTAMGGMDEDEEQDDDEFEEAMGLNQEAGA
ncbi:fibronectin type iii [Stemphylium lycopersici]|nr:fibronectin type iii [Stemphylium lycopersici]